jgi:hypothetical protein
MISTPNGTIIRLLVAYSYIVRVSNISHTDQNRITKGEESDNLDIRQSYFNCKGYRRTVSSEMVRRFRNGELVDLRRRPSLPILTPFHNSPIKTQEIMKPIS